MAEMWMTIFIAVFGSGCLLGYWLGMRESDNAWIRWLKERGQR